MCNAVFVSDKSGDIVDAEFYCSDGCAKTNPEYAGWYGCVELDFGQECSSDFCENKIHGIEECQCGEPQCYGFKKYQEERL